MQQAEILIISNSAGKRYIFFSALTRLGYRCYTAQNIQEAQSQMKFANKIKIVLLFFADGSLDHYVGFDDLSRNFFKKSTQLFLIGKQPQQQFQQIAIDPGTKNYNVCFLPNTTSIHNLIKNIQQTNLK